MLYIIFLGILFSLTTALSIFLMGSRDIIGPSFTLEHIIGLFFHWKFLLGIFFAFVTRIIFLMINGAIYDIPHLANSATTITAFVTTISLLFVLVANHLFLGEQLHFTQGIGAFLIVCGIFFIFH